MPVNATEVVVDMRPPPSQIFDDLPWRKPNYLRFRLGPDTAIALGADAKQPGAGMRGRDVELFVSQDAGEQADAYERLIGDALKGDATLFARQDEVEAAWAIVDPILPKVTCPSWSTRRAVGGRLEPRISSRATVVGTTPGQMHRPGAAPAA